MADITTEDYRRVLLCIPNLGWLHADLVERICLWRSHGMGYYAPVGLKPNDHARNTCVDHFLTATHAEYLLFVDHDTIPPRNAPLDLLRAQKDVISGCTPILKVDPSTGETHKLYVILRRGQAADGSVGLVPFMDEGIKSIDGCGASCLLIHRRVLDGMAFPFQVLFDPQTGMMQQGQDFTFCANAQDAGFDLFAHFGVMCRHVKEIPLE